MFNKIEKTVRNLFVLVSRKINIKNRLNFTPKNGIIVINDKRNQIVQQNMAFIKKGGI